MMLNRGCRAGDDGREYSREQGEGWGRADCLLSEARVEMCVDAGCCACSGKEIINQSCSLLKITIMMNIEQERLLLAPSVLSLYGWLYCLLVSPSPGPDV